MLTGRVGYRGNARVEERWRTVTAGGGLVPAPHQTGVSLHRATAREEKAEGDCQEGGEEGEAVGVAEGEDRGLPLDLPEHPGERPGLGGRADEAGAELEEERELTDELARRRARSDLLAER